LWGSPHIFFMGLFYVADIRMLKAYFNDFIDNHYRERGFFFYHPHFHAILPGGSAESGHFFRKYVA